MWRETAVCLVRSTSRGTRQRAVMSGLGCFAAVGVDTPLRSVCAVCAPPLVRACARAAVLTLFQVGFVTCRNVPPARPRPRPMPAARAPPTDRATNHKAEGEQT